MKARASDVWRGFGGEHLVGRPALCMWSWGVGASGQGEARDAVGRADRTSVLRSSNFQSLTTNSERGGDGLEGAVRGPSI